MERKQTRRERRAEWKTVRPRIRRAMQAASPGTYKRQAATDYWRNLWNAVLPEALWPHSKF
jgi:hypothetical protein